MEIIKYKFPKYISTTLKTMNTKKFLLVTYLLWKWRFLEHGNFVFGVLNEFDKKHNLTSDENIKNYISKTKRRKYKISYQRRLEGFLLDWVSNIFYNNHFKKILQIKTKKI